MHKHLHLWDDLAVPELVASLSGDFDSRPALPQGKLKQSCGALLLQRITAGKPWQNPPVLCSVCHTQHMIG